MQPESLSMRNLKCNTTMMMTAKSMTMKLSTNLSKCLWKKNKALWKASPRMIKQSPNPFPHKLLKIRSLKTWSKDLSRKKNSDKACHPMFGSFSKWDPIYIKEFNMKSRISRILSREMLWLRRLRQKLTLKEQNCWQSTSGYKGTFSWITQEFPSNKEYTIDIGTDGSKLLLKITSQLSNRLRKAINSQFFNQKLYTLLSQNSSLRKKWNKLFPSSNNHWRMLLKMELSL